MHRVKAGYQDGVCPFRFVRSRIAIAVIDTQEQHIDAAVQTGIAGNLIVGAHRFHLRRLINIFISPHRGPEHAGQDHR